MILHHILYLVYSFTDEFFFTTNRPGENPPGHGHGGASARSFARLMAPPWARDTHGCDVSGNGDLGIKSPKNAGRLLGECLENAGRMLEDDPKEKIDRLIWLQLSNLGGSNDVCLGTLFPSFSLGSMRSSDGTWTSGFSAWAVAQVPK